MLGEFKTFTSFSTSDLDAAKDFYSNKLGLEIFIEVDGAIRYKTGGDTGFMVYIKDNHIAATHTVLNFEVDDVEAEVKKLNELGVKMEQYPEMGTDELGISKMGEISMAWFKDPAGNILALLKA